MIDSYLLSYLLEEYSFGYREGYKGLHFLVATIGDGNAARTIGNMHGEEKAEYNYHYIVEQIQLAIDILKAYNHGWKNKSDNIYDESIYDGIMLEAYRLGVEQYRPIDIIQKMDHKIYRENIWSEDKIIRHFLDKKEK